MTPLQGDKPLPAPNRGGNLQGHSAEPVMLWTEAILNPAGPPRVHSDWPEVPYLDHIVAHDKEGRCFKVPYTTSKEVAKAWEVDHSTLCGKLLGHRRRKWKDTKPPRSSTSGAWDPRNTPRWGWPSCRCGPTSASPTMEPGRTETPSQACGTPWTGCRASQRASLRGKRFPLRGPMA